ncbi:DUF397 domain-containing protein [Umezawaea sp. NPDC059074]|uniref:DUF397 domain-containing protein n=1 Tax=Umezawaea sp. NPDC059074 TaxID=3346716 RepID=UPI0036B7E052
MTRWRKSSRSSANTDCVEIAGDLDAVRDSKNERGPVLKINRVALRTFLTGIKQGRFEG